MIKLHFYFYTVTVRTTTIIKLNSIWVEAGAPGANRSREAAMSMSMSALALGVAQRTNHGDGARSDELRPSLIPRSAPKRNWKLIRFNPVPLGINAQRGGAQRAPP